MSVRHQTFITSVGVPMLSLLFGQACSHSPARLDSPVTTVQPSSQWDALLRRIEAEGEGLNYPPELARHLDLPPSCAMKALSADGQAIDGLDRDVRLVLRDMGRPSAVIFQTARWGGKADRVVRYLVSLDGRLQRAVATEGKNDPKGRPIRGAGKVFPKNIHSREVRRGYQRELDFWLKGMYRKPSARASSSATK